MKNCYFVLIEKEGYQLLCPFPAYFASLPVAEHRHVAHLIDPISGAPLFFASAASRTALREKLVVFLGRLGLVVLPAPDLE